IATWRRKLDWIALHGGMALLNVHPDYMSFDGRPDSREYGAQLYQEFLEYVATRYGGHCWFALPRDLAEYVRSESAQPARRHRHPVCSTWRLRAKRVAMVLFSDYPVDQRPRRVAEAFVKAGMNVDVVCLPGGGRDPKRQTLNGVNIRRVSLTRRPRGILGSVFQYLAFLLSSSTILAMRSLTRRYDVVYVHRMPDILVLSGLVPKAVGARVILDLPDPMPELLMTGFNLTERSLRVRILKVLEKWSIRLADLALTGNTACQALF